MVDPPSPPQTPWLSPRYTNASVLVYEVCGFIVQLANTVKDYKFDYLIVLLDYQLELLDYLITLLDYLMVLLDFLRLS